MKQINIYMKKIIFLFSMNQVFIRSIHVHMKKSIQSLTIYLLYYEHQNNYTITIITSYCGADPRD
jgi:hypothetical protein